MANASQGGVNDANNENVDDRHRVMSDFIVPVSILNELNTNISRLDIQINDLEFVPEMFQTLQTVGPFSGFPSEDPYDHLRKFMEVADFFKIQGCSEDALRMKLFGFSLRDRARDWFYSLPPDSITSWNDLAKKFLMKYFPLMRNAVSRYAITSFQQLVDESVDEAWERFKELLHKCRNHGISKHVLLETFYFGLDEYTRLMVDASAGGSLLDKSYDEAYEIVERIASNNYQWSNPRLATGRRMTRVQDAGDIAALTAQVSTLTDAVKSMIMGTTMQFSSIESLLKEYMAKNDAIIRSHAVRLRNLENQVGYLTTALNNCPQGFS